MDLSKIRRKVLDFHQRKGYLVKPAVPLTNAAFPYTFNASAAEIYMKEIVESGVKNPRAKFIVVQPCFRRVDIENISLNGYLSFFEMVGKIVFTPAFEEEKAILLQEMLNLLVNEIQLEKEKIWISIFGGGRIAEKGLTQCPEDIHTAKLWEKMDIPKERIIGIESKGEDIDNFLVRFDRKWEKYAGYGTDIYYDLGEKFTSSPHDTKPGEVKGGRFIELATIWMLNKWRISKPGKDVEFAESEFKNYAIGFSLERLAYVSQKNNHILDLQEFDTFLKIFKEKLPKKNVYPVADLLRAIFFIMSENNKPGKKGREYDLRLLFRKLFCQFEGSLIQNAEYLVRTTLEGNNQHNRKQIFSEMNKDEIELLKKSYSEFLQYYKKIYPELHNQESTIISSYKHEKYLFYEKEFQKKS